MAEKLKAGSIIIEEQTLSEVHGQYAPTKEAGGFMRFKSQSAKGSWLMFHGPSLIGSEPWCEVRGSWLMAQGSWHVAYGSWVIAHPSLLAHCPWPMPHARKKGAHGAGLCTEVALLSWPWPTSHERAESQEPRATSHEP